ncbi:sulfotransferase [Rhodanobacter sp. L36]|uniref:tetratricopeptide repeat-containing sulfotransferase family protein n=1 Tax=Rhodanobacter sp. L36 TaxID=1747221 RepID=UPI00131B2B42|nr:sulfotransferase [Rhodanobacter sp. L36]
MTDATALYARLTEAFNRRAWQQAEKMADELLSIAPRHPGGLYIAGLTKLELGQMPKALEYLRKATIVEPTRVDFAVQLAKAFSLVNRNSEAEVAANAAMALSPTHPAMLDTLGVIFSNVGAYASAAAAFRVAVKSAPAHVSYRYNLATALVAAGDIDEAETEIETCIDQDPTYWRAHLTLAQLKRQTAASHHVERLESLLSDVSETPVERPARMWLNMAIAKEYEDLADYPKAFDHLVLGKNAAIADRSYSIEQDEALFASIMHAFPQPQAPVDGYPTHEPIFIIGMPRSGTTLVERIISSHLDVQSAGELLNFAMSLKFVSGSKTEKMIDPDIVSRVHDTDWNRLGEIYLSSTRPATGQRPRFIDKLPHNFLYAGFIAKAMPNAKIICLRRNPMDTCLSNFRQLFAPNSPFFDYSFDLLDTGRYYVLFDRLMAHWQRVFPGRILEIDYEDLVDSQEENSRRLLEFCDLPWNDACLRFEENSSPVATASSVQVREPLYRSAMERWKKYGSRLDELQALLTSAGIKIERQVVLNY